jgi:hypothetical protein
MSSEIKIIQFDDALRKGFFDFSQLVHPKENSLKERMQWFTFNNPLAQSKSNLPGLVTITTDNELVGQFLMSPFEFLLRGKKHSGYFGYDFFVKEEFRSRGAGALLFVQGVRMYGPFIGVGLTPIVEKISKAAGMQTIGQLKRFIWVKNPLLLSGHLLKQRFMSGSSEADKTPSREPLADSVTVSGVSFQLAESLIDGFGLCSSDETLEPVRSKEFLQWRFGDSPCRYHVYVQPKSPGPLYFAVRRTVYQGMKLLLIVDYRFPQGQWQTLDFILQAAKEIATQVQLDGVMMSSTCVPAEEALVRERFKTAGRTSSVIAYLPSQEFSPPVNSICLTVADSDLEFSLSD